MEPPIAVQAKSTIRWGKITLWVLVLIFVGMQFFQPDKNNTSFDKSRNIAVLAAVPDSVDQLLQAACYDCHSNNTRYPWYTNIQPVGWWLRHHINDGKQYLNFDEFATYTPAQQQDELDGIIETQQKKSMPLTSYTWIHKDARLTSTQRQQIIAWAEQTRRAIGNK